jgi:DNA-binding IclR family transcriptional regulator
MNKGGNHNVSRVIYILKCLRDNEFQGQTESEISERTGIPLTTVFRILNALKRENCVVDAPVPGSKLKVWKISTEIVEFAHAYERYALKKVQQVKAEYLAVTGTELRA